MTTTTQNSDSTAPLCLDVKQHIIGFLGVDVQNYLFRLELEATSAATSVLERGPKKARRGSKPNMPNKQPKHRTESEKLFPWLSSAEIHQPLAVQDLTTVQLLSSTWYHAFHSTVLEADHIIVYRALQMRTRVRRFREDAAEYVNHIQCYESSATRVVLQNTYAASWVSADSMSPKIDTGKVKSSLLTPGEGSGMANVSPLAELPKSLVPETATRQLDQLTDVCKDLADLAQRLHDKCTEIAESDQSLAVAAAADDFIRKSHQALLRHLSRASLTELASFAKPPSMVITALGPIGQLVQPHKVATWTNLKTMLRSPDLIGRLEQAATRALSNAAERKRLERIAVAYPVAPVFNIKAVSVAAGNMYEWFLDLVTTCSSLIHPEELEDEEEANIFGLSKKQLEKAKQRRLADFAALVVFHKEVRNLLNCQVGFSHAENLVESCLMSAESAIRASIVSEAQYEILRQVRLSTTSGGCESTTTTPTAAAAAAAPAATLVVGVGANSSTSVPGVPAKEPSKTSRSKDPKSAAKSTKIAADPPTTRGHAVVHRHFVRQSNKK